MRSPRPFGVSLFFFVGFLYLACGGGGSESPATGGGLATGGTSMSMGGTTATGGNSGAGPGTPCQAAGTIPVASLGASAYVIDQANNPTLTLCRGNTYVFSVNAPGHPFFIKTAKVAGVASAYDTGVTGNGNTVGDVTFVVPLDAPSTLYYICSLHVAMTGLLHIVD